MAEADEAKPKKDPKDNKVKVKPMKLLWHDPDHQSFLKPTPHVYLPGASVGSVIQLDISRMCLAYWKSDQRHYQAYLKGGVLLSSLFDDAVARPMALAMLHCCIMVQRRCFPRCRTTRRFQMVGIELCVMCTWVATEGLV